jgi:hypothetical protein
MQTQLTVKAVNYVPVDYFLYCTCTSIQSGNIQINHGAKTLLTQLRSTTLYFLWKKLAASTIDDGPFYVIVIH